jgi:hypothetical protein
MLPLPRVLYGDPRTLVHLPDALVCGVLLGWAVRADLAGVCVTLAVAAAFARHALAHDRLAGWRHQALGVTKIVAINSCYYWLSTRPERRCSGQQAWGHSYTERLPTPRRHPCRCPPAYTISTLSVERRAYRSVGVGGACLSVERRACLSVGCRLSTPAPRCRPRRWTRAARPRLWVTWAACLPSCLRRPPHLRSGSRQPPSRPLPSPPLHRRRRQPHCRPICSAQPKPARQQATRTHATHSFQAPPLCHHHHHLLLRPPLLQHTHATIHPSGDAVPLLRRRA